MLFPIFFAIPIAFYADVPLLPVIVVSALFQSGVAYAITSNSLCIHSGVSVAVVGCGKFLVLPMLADSAGAQSTYLSVSAVDALTTQLLWAVAVIGLVTPTVIGLLGGRDDEGYASEPIRANRVPLARGSTTVSRTTTVNGSAASRSQRPQPRSDDDSFPLSMAVGAATGSTVLGYAAGGSLSGAILGAELGSRDSSD